MPTLTSSTRYKVIPTNAAAAKSSPGFRCGGSDSATTYGEEELITVVVSYVSNDQGNLMCTNIHGASELGTLNCHWN